MLPPSDDTLMDETEKDLAALQGVWEQVAHEADGLINPPDEHGAPGALTTFSGRHFAVRTVQGELLLEGTFTLNASLRPKAIDWADSMGGRQGQGIACQLQAGRRPVCLYCRR